MEIFGGLDDSLRAMGFVQQLVAFLFLASYTLALGGLLPDVRGRVRAWCFSGAMALAFVALTRPWVNGALLVAFSVAALGVFIAVVWILSAVLEMRRRAMETAAPVLASTSAPSDAGPAQQMPSQAGGAPSTAAAQGARAMPGDSSANEAIAKA
jgi:hypothetical protein